jgi:hypothetical protein
MGRAKKFWHVFLLIALPLFGWLVGTLLRPAVQPLWTKKGMRSSHVLGITQNSKDILVCNDLLNPEVIKIDMQKGDERGQEEMPPSWPPRSAQRPFYFGPDEESIYYLPHRTSIYRYHWGTKRVTHQYQIRNSESRINEYQHENRSQVALVWKPTGNSSTSYLYVFDEDNPQPKLCIEIGQQAAGLYVSPDASLAGIVTRTNNIYSIAIVDLVKGTVMQRLPSDYLSAHWSTDSQSFYTLTNDANGHFMQQWNRQGECFVKGTTKYLCDSIAGSFHIGPYVYVQQFHTSAWRNKVQEKLPEWGVAILDIVWPKLESVSIHEPCTGTRLKTIKLPANSKSTVRVTRDLRYYLLLDGASITCYPLIDPPWWPAGLGASLGFLMAVFFVGHAGRASPR